MAQKSHSWTDSNCHPEIQNEVDSLVLDYLAYNAIKTIELAALPTAASGRKLSYEALRQKAPNQVEDAIHMVDAYLAPLQGTFAFNRVGSSVEFRLQLLKFLATFRFQVQDEQGFRNAANVDNLRTGNGERIKAWYANAQTEILPNDIIDWFSNFTLAPTDSGAEQHSSQPLNLLDQLTPFISLLAVRSDLGRRPLSERCFDLAAQFMLQSVLQQYTRLGCKGIEPITNSFSWGFEGMTRTSHELETHSSRSSNDNQAKILLISKQAHSNDLSNDIINSAFCTVEHVSADDSQPVSRAWETTDVTITVLPQESWRRIRHAYMMCLLPVPKGDTEFKSAHHKDLRYAEQKGNYYDTVTHLHSLCWDNPVEDFMQEVMSLLSNLNESVARPVLTQLEAAQANEGFKLTTKLEIAQGLDKVEIPWEEAEGLSILAQKLTK